MCLVRPFTIVVPQRHGENFPQTCLVVADHLPNGLPDRRRIA